MDDSSSIRGYQPTHKMRCVSCPTPHTTSVALTRWLQRPGSGGLEQSAGYHGRMFGHFGQGASGRGDGAKVGPGHVRQCCMVLAFERIPLSACRRRSKNWR